MKLRVAEVEAVQVLRPEDVAGRGAGAPAPAGEHDAGVRDAQRLARVLLYQQDADADRVDPLYFVEYIAHVLRRQPGRGLVEHQDLGPHGERAGEGEHLPLAAAQVSRLRPVARGELGQEA